MRIKLNSGADPEIWLRAQKAQKAQVAIWGCAPE